MDQIEILGPVRIRIGARTVTPRDFEGVKPREVLCVLAAHGGRPVAKESLGAHLWGRELPPSWLSTLEGYVSLLRRALDPGRPARESVVVTQRGGYLLDTGRVQLDLVRFLDLVVEADATNDRDALPLLNAAMRLVRGDLLEAERPLGWIAQARAQHADRVRRAALRAARLSLSTARLDDALRLAESVCVADPLCEDAWQTVMEAHWRAGRRTDALRAFRQLRTNLCEELGIGVGAGVSRLHQDILRDEAAPAVA